MTDFYVSLKGENNNNGTSPETPWRSIQKGINALSAGDTLHIAGGVYNLGEDNFTSTNQGWQIRDKRGTATKPIVVKRMDGETDPVVLSGGDEYRPNGSYYPNGGLRTNDSYVLDGEACRWTWVGLVTIQYSSYISIQDIEVIKGMGIGIHIGREIGDDWTEHITEDQAFVDHITLRDVKVHSHRCACIMMHKAYWVDIKRCEVSFGGWAKTHGSCGIRGVSAYYTHVDDCVLHHHKREIMEFDSNKGNSEHVYIRNNVLFDFGDPILLHAINHVICVGNFLYRTPEEQQKQSFRSTTKSINIKPTEYDIINKKGCKYILVAGNVIANTGIGLSITSDNEQAAYPVEYIYLIGNTLSNCNTGVSYHNYASSNCVFKNNISINDNASEHVVVHVGNNLNPPTGFDTDYNLYEGSDPESNINSNMKGSNDQYDADADLRGTSVPSKGDVYLLAGYWVNFDLQYGYDDASNFAIEGTGGDAYNAGTTVSAPSGWNSDSNDDSMADYIDYCYYFLPRADRVFSSDSDQYDPAAGVSHASNPRRSEIWDIGADEYREEPAIVADFSANPSTGEAPLKVAFTDLSKSNLPITSRFWDFGDGVISTENNPVHEYTQGLYTVSLKVTNKAGFDIATKNSLISVTAPIETQQPRVSEGLQVLYTFDEGSGDTIHDVSNVGEPLNLKIDEPLAVEWREQWINIRRSVIISSGGPAAKINNACRENGELTIEAWVWPDNIQQDGPARIASISQNLYSRNITLGQGLWGTQPSDLFDLRLRTTERSANGMPSFFSPSGTAETSLTHLVFTRGRNGRSRIIINKIVVAETIIPGDFSTWNPRFPLVLANEVTGEYPWIGRFYLIAIYDRELTLTEVKQNYDAGTDLAPQVVESDTAVIAAFRRFVLVENGNGVLSTNDIGKAVAYGVQYPDLRCVLCAEGKGTSMAIYRDVNAIIRTYGKQDLNVKWID